MTLGFIVGRIPERRWRVTGRGRGLFVIEVDDGDGFRAATAAEVDAALRQRELFGAADYPVQRDDAAERAGDERRHRLTASGALGGGVMEELYAWVWSVFPSLGQAVRVARGYAACDGGGRWRVYGTRVVSVGDGTLEAVLGHRLAEGLETHRQD